MRNHNYLLIVVCVMLPASADANVVGLIESLTVTSDFVDGSSWRGSTWEGVTSDGTAITAIEDSEVSFGSMVMDPWLMDSELISAQGEIQLFDLPRHVDTPIVRLDIPAQVLMSYRSVDIDSGDVSEWNTGVVIDGIVQGGWIDAVATVHYSLDQRLGVYDVSSLSVVTVPEPGSLLMWSFGLCSSWTLWRSCKTKRRLN